MVIDSKKWLIYVQAVKDRDSHRKAAEQADKERRKHWRKYYATDRKILELNKELGIDESFLESDDEEIQILTDEEVAELKNAAEPKACPGAPKKRKVINN